MKLIFLSSVFFCLTQMLQAQQWNQIGFSEFGVSEFDLHIDKSNGELSIAQLATPMNLSTVTVWENDSWQILGDENFGPSNQLYVKTASANGEHYAAIKFGLGPWYIRVYKLNAGIWTPMGNQDYLTDAGESFSLEIADDGSVYLSYFDMSFTFGQYYQINVLSVTETNQVQVGGSLMTSGYAQSPSDLAIDPSGEIFCGYADGGGVGGVRSGQLMSSFWMSSGDLFTNFSGWDVIVNEAPNSNVRTAALGGNALVYTRQVENTDITISTTAEEFDMASSSDLDYFFYTSNSFSNHIISVNSSGLVTDLGTNVFSTIGYSPEIEFWNGRLVAGIIQGGGELVIKELDNPATATITGNIEMCEENLTMSANDLIVVDDNNYSHANLEVTASSGNTVIIPNAYIFFTGSYPEFGIEVNSTNVTANQIVNIDINLVENGVPSLAGSVPVNIINSPNSLILLTDVLFCENEEAITLSSFGFPAGGSWTGQGIVTGNKFDPQAAGSGIQPISYTVINSQGCEGVSTIDLVVYEIPEISFSVISTVCGDNNGEIDASVTSGLSPYFYDWSSGQQTQDVSNLEAGIYTLHVTDQQGCVSSMTASTTETVFSLDATVTDVACYGLNNGAIDLLLSADDLLLVEEIIWSSGHTSADITNLEAGVYDVNVKGIDGCLSFASFVVDSPQNLSAEIMAVDASCGAADGSLISVISGGAAPYIYQWFDSGMLPIGSGLDYLSGIEAGAYSVEVTDMNGCTLLAHTSVSEINGPVVQIDGIVPSGCSNDGAISITVNGMYPIVSTIWSNGLTDEDITNIASGFYYVEATDDQGCSGLAVVEVAAVGPDPIDICLVTVDTLTNTNLVVWEKPITSDIDYFNIYRETSVAGEFLFVGSVAYSDESVYTDPVASPLIRSWRYKLSVVSTCGTESELSDLHKTIHLTSSQGVGSSVHLNWDEYEGFSFSGYNIYRYTDQSGWELIQVMPVNLFSYTDIPPSTAGLEYMISVTPPSTCTSTTYKVQDHNSSRSNKSTTVIDDGGSGIDENETFNFLLYPNPSNGNFVVDLNGFQTEEEISLEIYDALGQLILSKTLESDQEQISISEPKSGIYTLHISVSGSAKVQKIIIY